MQWAILHGEEGTGITVIRMNERMDAGDILYQEKVPLTPEEDAAALSSRLALRVSEILPPVVEEVKVKGVGYGTPQDEREASYTPIITKEMGHIDWSLRATEIIRQVRALVLWPTAYTFLDGKAIKVFKVRPSHATSSQKPDPGTILASTPAGIEVSAGVGSLILQEIQMENRKRMAASDFAKGYRQICAKLFT
jgi:methionyl-tRNA formyltransferase